VSLEPGFVVRNHPEGGVTIGALERGLAILEALGESPDLQLIELAARLGAPKGSIHRHLAVLERLGYVVRAPDSKRYSLGPRLIHLGYSARGQLRLADLAEPLMTEVRDRFNESVHLGVIDNGQVVHVQAVPSRHPVKMAAAVGERTQAHVSALGKVLLAWGPPSLLDTVIDSEGLPGYTGNTLTTRGQLAADLDLVRERGYAIDDEESALGLRCVAARIRRAGGDVIAALSLSSPAERLSAEQVHVIAPAICEAADSISKELGWREAEGARSTESFSRSSRQESGDK
jgi:DNA-binding IclR family transcriptional regulator